MVTLLYALVGTGVLAALFLVPILDHVGLSDWAHTAWLRYRLDDSRRVPLDQPPRSLGGRVYAATFLWIVVLFLGALALPR